MKIGILGTGDVGRALAGGFAALGHQVKVGTRDPASDTAKALAAKLGPKVEVVTFAAAATFADVAVLATLWSGTESAIRLAGPGHLYGKVVIDATNPLTFAPGAPPALALGHTDSGGEQVQRWLPAARVVKAFNTVGYAHMVKPAFPGGPPDMFICGNDAQAKATVTELLKALGWPAIDVGGIEGARLLEPLCILWVVHGARSGSWDHAFKMLRK
jgi:8-hydroxy-5-deazaflavin:NADPH oxidoreductase